MDQEHDQSGTAEPAPTTGWVQPKPKGRGRRLERIAVGAIVTFATMSLLVGVPNAGQMLALAVVCTAGIGLIPILFLCWVVGWIVLTVWDDIARRRSATAA